MESLPITVLSIALVTKGEVNPINQGIVEYFDDDFSPFLYFCLHVKKVKEEEREKKVLKENRSVVFKNEQGLLHDGSVDY